MLKDRETAETAATRGQFFFLQKAVPIAAPGQSHRTKLPYFRNELVEKSVNGQTWQTGQTHFLVL